MLGQWKKRWYIVLLCGLLGAGALFLEKWYFAPTMPQTGYIVFAQTVRFDSPALLENTVTSRDVPIRKGSVELLADTFSNRLRFLEQSGKEFDYGRLNVNWRSMSMKDRYQWMERHLLVDSCGGNVYEFTLYFDINDAKDASYILDNGDAYLTAYVHFMQEAAKVVAEDVKAEPLSSYHFFTNAENVTRKDVLIKYAVIGFVLGSLAGCALIWAWKKRA